MLREYKQLKQESGPGSRRWFESDGFDLIVWLDRTGSITGYQICYDFGRGEHALTWRSGEGCSHHRVDTGDTSPLGNESPVLVADGNVPWQQLTNVFNARSGTLDASLRELVRRTLQPERRIK